MADSKLLKSINLDDLAQYACWRHFIEDEVEFVSPVDKNEIFEMEQEGYIVRTQFRLADNSTYIGFCSPQDTSGIDYIQPVIVTGNGHLPFFLTKKESAIIEEKVKSVLNKSTANIFPITYVAEVKCDGEFYKGLIESFEKE
jgi:hypothetical protein